MGNCNIFIIHHYFWIVRLKLEETEILQKYWINIHKIKNLQNFAKLDKITFNIIYYHEISINFQEILLNFVIFNLIP
jgi:hypothetical protein